MLQEAKVEVRGWVPPDRPTEDGKPQNYFIFVNDNSYLVYTPFPGNLKRYVTLEWDGKIGPSQLVHAASVEIPTAMGLKLSPEEILRETTSLYANFSTDQEYKLDLAKREDFQNLKTKSIEDPDGYFRFDVGQGLSGPNSMLREYYSWVILDPRGDNPAAYAFRDEGFEKKYVGREMELTLEESFIIEPVVLWIAQHHMSLAALDITDKITETITQIRTQ